MMIAGQGKEGNRGGKRHSSKVTHKTRTNTNEKIKITAGRLMVKEVEKRWGVGGGTKSPMHEKRAHIRRVWIVIIVEGIGGWESGTAGVMMLMLLTPVVSAAPTTCTCDSANDDDDDDAHMHTDTENTYTQTHTRVHSQMNEYNKRWNSWHIHPKTQSQISHMRPKIQKQT
jgi:hypothetical protein